MKFLIILITAMLIAGCRSGGSSGSSSGSGLGPDPVLGSSYGSYGGSVPLAHTPEPGTLVLLGTGLAGLAAVMLRKNWPSARD